MADVPKAIETRGYELEFEDDFNGPDLDRSKWLPFYLPHWASRDATATRYRIADGCLILAIEEGQPAWAPEIDGEVRVSSIQSGVFAGPAGSENGQHRFKPGLVVREEQAPEQLHVGTYGYYEIRAKLPAAPQTHAAFWLIGFEDEPARSGEIAVFAIDGASLRPYMAEVGYGIVPWGDSALQSSFFKDEMLVDAHDFHTYAIEWMPKRVDFFIDGKRVRTIPQAPDYPMQMMLGLYEDPTKPSTALKLPDAGYPRELVVDWVRVWKRSEPAAAAAPSPAPATLTN